METDKTLETPLEKTIQVLGFRVSVISMVLGQSARLGVFLNCIFDEKPFIDCNKVDVSTLV